LEKRVIMSKLPTLTTDRLVLRAFTLDDAPRVQALAGRMEIARTTLTIPHPYEDGMAEEWISTHAQDFENQQVLNLAICLRDGLLIGAIGLMPELEHRRAEIGYWVGMEYWGHGYCTEAAQAVMQYGFKELGLERIYGFHFSNNPASGRVMEKLGMEKEGVMRRHIQKWGQRCDVVCYGILRDEYYARAGARLKSDAEIQKACGRSRAGNRERDCGRDCFPSDRRTAGCPWHCRSGAGRLPSQGHPSAYL
jgi:RimJ/RimL family protein N-acetyltransferase